MAFNNPLSTLFGQSPIKPIENHMAIAVDTARQLPSFFTAVIKEDWDEAADVHKRIRQLEHDADAQKRELRLHLPKSLFLPVPRSDLLEILAMQDKIANRTQDIAGIMFGRKMTIPSPMQNIILDFVNSAVATSEQALKAINELDELLESGFSGPELNIVENLIKELDRLESESDHQEVTVRAELFKLEAVLPPIDVMFLYKVIDWVGDLADRAQSVGGRLQLLLAR